MPIQIDHNTSYTQAPVRVLEDPQGRRYGYRAISWIFDYAWQNIPK